MLLITGAWTFVGWIVLKSRMKGELTEKRPETSKDILVSNKGYCKRENDITFRKIRHLWEKEKVNTIEDNELKLLEEN